MDTDEDVQSTGYSFSAISFFVPDVRWMMFSRMYRRLERISEIKVAHGL
jgi:hypothetical protein